MTTIWKFPLEITGSIQKIQIPLFAEILTVQLQFGYPCIWAQVNPELKGESRCFQLIGTGNCMPILERKEERQYIGTVQLDFGSIVLHLFEIITKPDQK